MELYGADTGKLGGVDNAETTAETRKKTSRNERESESRSSEEQTERVALAPLLATALRVQVIVTTKCPLHKSGPR